MAVTPLGKCGDAHTLHLLFCVYVTVHGTCEEGSQRPQSFGNSVEGKPLRASGGPTQGRCFPGGGAFDNPTAVGFQRAFRKNIIRLGRYIC